MREYKPLEPPAFVATSAIAGGLAGLCSWCDGHIVWPERRSALSGFDLFPELNPATRSSCANKW